MHLSILWHHHQPIYRHPKTEELILPWVNYHITKNYYQMAVLAEEEGYPCTFNLVPCLLEQIELYSRGEARDSLQQALEKDPEKLTRSQLARLVKFLPPGSEKNSKKAIQLEALRSFFSPLLKTKGDKESLLDTQKKIHQQVIPLYRKIWKSGLAELTTSAYYHPLLPLVFDIRVGGETLMPSSPFSRPQDAEAQIENGREYFRRLFGENPRGFWPSEAAVSEEVTRAVAAKGFGFAVTDENVLWKTLNTGPDPKLLYQPHISQGLAIFFRDRELSDLISFEYHRWNESEAVSHFLAKLKERRKAAPESSICVVALDGENPWAGYRENGVPFIRELYRRIKQTPELHPTSLGDFVRLNPPQNEIRLVPGTWLGSFAKWIGSPAKNAAWESLARTREDCGLCEEIFVAEGSDWFWWFGEDNVAEFAALFKSYLEKACERQEK
jgi:alpha-amylase/alpha-mannosidase (GH57 family)